MWKPGFVKSSHNYELSKLVNWMCVEDPFSQIRLHITNPGIPLVLALRLSALTEVLHISCNMGTRDLPEMYARSPRAVPSDFGHTFLANHSCPCYNYKIKI